MSDYELTPEEKEHAIAEALHKATEQKRRDMAYRARIEEDKNREKEALRPWTATEYLEYIKARALTISERANPEKPKPLAIDKNNELVIKMLCLYFAGDKKFCEIETGTNKMSLDKGLCLCGGIGSGKTYLMKLFQLNKKRSFKVVPVRRIADLYSEIGTGILYDFSIREYNIPRSYSSFLQNEFGRCYDDIGAENSSRNNFGNRLNVMREIITNLYEYNTPYWWWHMTTNLNQDQLLKVYGERAFSRMMEMFNFIQLPGGDRRKLITV